jgi:cytochrome oxidase Cu insertion factor (SCO1/SenC/PrrC family)
MAVSARATAPARPRRGGGPAALALLVAGALGIAIGIGLALLHSPASSSVTAPALHGEATWAPGARPAPAIASLRDQSGRAFSLAALRGHTVVIAFMDSRCTAACPLEGRALAAAEQALPAGQRPVLVAVSVNPLDTQASARAAARKWGLAGLGTWHWLMGSRRALARVWAAYRIAVQIPAHGDIVHTEALYLLDRHGDERSGYLYPFMPQFVRGDLALLSRGGSV